MHLLQVMLGNTSATSGKTRRRRSKWKHTLCTRLSKMVDEFSEVIKLTNGLNSLSEDQLTNIKDQVWNTYVTNELIAAEAKKLGLKVTDKELQAIIDEGTNPLLMQTPFRNPQTGAFDKDMLKKFLVDYANLDASKMPAQYVEYYQTMGNFWKFVERTLKQSVLAENTRI